jgi:mRNA interferase RelE/StbE
MPYTLVYTSRALKDLENLSKAVNRRIVTALERLAADDDPEGSVKRLQNSPLYSLRVGAFRVILDIRREKITIFVLRAGPRRTDTMTYK